MDDSRSLADLRADFRATSTASMPLAGLLVWAALGIAALWLPERTTAMLALYVLGAILPLAFLLDRLRGRALFSGGTKNPLTRLFLMSIGGIAVTIPIGVIGANMGGEPTLVVLTMAILAGVIWIPYGWAAGDPVGLRHAIARALGSYAAFAWAPPHLQATAICAVVSAAYAYSLLRMKKAG